MSMSPFLLFVPALRGVAALPLLRHALSRVAALTLLSITAGCHVGTASHEVREDTPGADIIARLTGSAADKSSLLQLYRDTLQAGEPEAVVYISSVAEELQPLTQAFADAFPGVKINFQRLMGDKLRARLDGEFNSGKHAADIVIGGSIGQTLSSMPKDRWQSYLPATASTLAARYRDPDNFYHIVYKKSFTLAYNPSLIKPEDIPRTIGQVLDARWKNRYSHPSFGAFSTADAAVRRLYEKGELNDSQLAAFVDNGMPAPPSSEIVPWVAQGRLVFAVWLNAAAVLAQQAQGANVALAFSPALDILSETGIGILKGAPHPQAARLVTAWLYTPRAQAILSQLNFYGVMPGTPLPAGLPAPDQYLNADDVEDEQLLRDLSTFRRQHLSPALKKS
jgi:iron(III) transport system substrate-binding protein